MKITENTLENISDKLFFLLLIIFQSLFLFQGLDFADEGFHAAFYQQIFINPFPFAINFMYWLNGVLGGSILYLFPESGLLGMRLLGLVIVTSTILTAYYTLKKYLVLSHLRLGIIILVFFISNDLKEIHYDNLSALLSLSSAVLLFNGLKRNSHIKIILSGALISLNLFTRTPGIAMLVFSLAIIYDGILNKQKVKYQLRQLIVFFSGFGIMTILVLFFMKLINHLDLYLESLEIVFGWGTSEYDSHNISGLLKNFVKDYSISLIYGFLFIIFILLVNSIRNLLELSIKSNFKRISWALFFLFIFSIIYLTISQKITWISMLWVFTGLSLLVSVLILTTNHNKEIKLLVFLGCLILLFAPLGSAGGLFFMGRYSLWLIFPIAVDFIWNIKSIESKFQIFSGKTDYLVGIKIGETQLQKTRKYSTGLLIFICLFYSYYYPYFDKSDRAKMLYSVDNEYVKGIYTSKERANVINELLIESKKYIRKGDMVLAYDCIPMFHYLTETMPYMRNAWPWLFTPEKFKNELDNSIKRSAELPVIVLQKFSTLDNDWPENHLNTFQKSKPDFIRDSILNDFMKNNNYNKVWENKAFEIRVPAKL